MSSLFDRNYEGFKTIFFENFEIFSDSFSITIWYPKILIPSIWRKPVSCRRLTLPAGLAHALIVRALAMGALYRYGSDRNVPFHFTKLFSPRPLICIMLTSTITKLAVALVWSVQLECTFHWPNGFSQISNKNFC